MTPSPNSRRSSRGGRRRGRGPSAHDAASDSPSRGRSRGTVEPLHPTATPPEIDSFLDWSLGPEIQTAIAAMDIVRPTPIQALAIGPVLAGRDVIAKAETGTGKTLAFGAPMLARIDPGRRTVLGLVLAPTRELSEQVHGVLEVLGAARGVRTALIVGGEPMGPQVAALQAGAQVVVGTPGRVLDLLRQGFLSFPWTEYVVLDEADKMLEIGFIDDVKAILAAANDERQTLLFSATFPTPLLRLARESTRDPVEVATSLGVSTVETIEQFLLEVSEDDAPRALLRLMDLSAPDDVFLVFCDRRTDVDKLLRRIERGRHPVKALHGGYDQASRFRVMSAFRTGEVKCLIATDVASRGLDVEHVTHVINYGVPRDPSDYTHRIGRTGRAGRAGTSLTLVTPANRRRWHALQAGLPFTIHEIAGPARLFDPRPPRGQAAPAAEEPVLPVLPVPGAREPDVSEGEAPEGRRERTRTRRARGAPEERAPEPAPAAAREEEPAAEAEPARPALPARPARERAPETSRPRREAPRRPREAPEPAPEPAPAPAPERESAAPDTFGAGILDEQPGGRRKRRSERPDRSQAPEARPEPEPEPERGEEIGWSAFGAGL